jgi:uncharacterized membrane protein YccC
MVESTARLRLQMRLALTLVGIGGALLVMMIVVEDEPGAIPLLLVVTGIGWYLLARSRFRRLR